FPDGGRLARYLPAGRTLIRLQSAAEGALGGEAEVLQRPVAPIEEGLGAAARLGPGETRLYGLRLEGPGAVGIGLRAAVDIAECRLLDADGRLIGSGITQMHKLAAGRYVLAVALPPDAAPVEIQPALVGQRLPDSGPPDEVKRKYLQLVGRL